MQTHSDQNCFDKYQKPTALSTLNMSNNANENSYMTNARNLTGPSRVNGCRSNHLPDRQQRKEKEPDLFTRENIEWTDYICHFQQVSMWNN